MRCIVAGGVAGVWGDCGGIGPQLANLVNVALVGFTGNQEAAAELHGAQDTESRQLARDRRDLSGAERQLLEPHQPRIMRTLAGQKKVF